MSILFPPFLSNYFRFNILWKKNELYPYLKVLKLLSVASCARQPVTSNQQPITQFNQKQMASFSQIINGETPVLIDFHATWCGPCKALAPIIKNVKKKIGDKAKIIKIDIDKNQALANKLQIKGVPTLILYKGGEQQWRQSGVVSELELIRVIGAHL